MRMSEMERIRLVTLGGTGVGKSAIVKRFLFNTFSDKHKPTVEDLYTQEFDLGPSTSLKVDFLDTSGDPQFPAMRRLSITTANAFLLVYALNNKSSFEQVKGYFEEIREHRSDFQEIPIVIAGNKSDVPTVLKDVEFDEVCDWVHESLPKIRGKAMECSAKEGRNVREIFKTFLSLSGIIGPSIAIAEEPAAVYSGLRRRSSAHAGTKGHSSTATPPPSSCSSPKMLGMLRGTLSTPTEKGRFDFEEGISYSLLNRNKPRSRSLIRRSSKKTKPQMRDASGAPGDCVIS